MKNRRRRNKVEERPARKSPRRVVECIPVSDLMMHALVDGDGSIAVNSIQVASHSDHLSPKAMGVAKIQVRIVGWVRKPPATFKRDASGDIESFKPVKE